MLWACLLCLAISASLAQPVQVYSEFARVNDAGGVTAPEDPREILSPLAPRNAFTSFQLVIQLSPGTKFSLFAGQNPDDAAKITMYRRVAGALEPIVLPFDGDSTQIFWMDVHVAKTSPVRRVKIEPQVLIGGDWTIYPMEVRVVEATVPDTQPTVSGSDAYSILLNGLCHPDTPASNTNTNFATQLAVRNARQDLALVAGLNPEGREALFKVAGLKLAGGCNAKPPANPEFYLKIRDSLLRQTSKTMP